MAHSCTKSCKLLNAVNQTIPLLSKTYLRQKRQTHVPYYYNTAEHADNSLLEATNKTELTESSYMSGPSGCSSTNESVDEAYNILDDLYSKLHNLCLKVWGFHIKATKG